MSSLLFGGIKCLSSEELMCEYVHNCHTSLGEDAHISYYQNIFNMLDPIIGLTLEFLSYEILEIFMQTEFRISRKNAPCFAKFRVSRNWFQHAKLCYNLHNLKKNIRNYETKRFCSVSRNTSKHFFGIFVLFAVSRSHRNSAKQ